MTAGGLCFLSSRSLGGESEVKATSTEVISRHPTTAETRFPEPKHRHWGRHLKVDDCRVAHIYFYEDSHEDQ